MQELRNRMSRLERDVTEILGLLRKKGKKAVENANSYVSRKAKRIRDEEARRQDRHKNPDGSPFEWSALECNRVVDAFVRRERMHILLMMSDMGRNNAIRVLEMLLRFWLDYYWERPVRVSGAGFSTFTGWTIDREGRGKPKRQLIRPSGDVVFLVSKFGTARPWDGTKATKLGEPLMWCLLGRLVSRLVFVCRYDISEDEEMEDCSEWAEANPEAIKVLEFLGGDGWSFNDDISTPGDKLHIMRPFTLWEFNRDTFHKKIGKILPLLASVSTVFERAVRDAST